MQRQHIKLGLDQLARTPSKLPLTCRLFMFSCRRRISESAAQFGTTTSSHSLIHALSLTPVFWYTHNGMLSPLHLRSA